jgi:hypothetical protein
LLNNNKITYQIKGKITENDIKLPFNSDIFKTILHANKDMGGGKLFLSSMGLIQVDFELEDIFSRYWIVRKAETEF